MKVSYTNSKNVDKRKGGPDHNDRHIKPSSAEHIDTKRSHLNIYMCIYKDMTFREAERKFYRENFSKFRREHNRKVKKGRHFERRMTLDSMLKNPRTCPEETIIQIGNVNVQPDPDDPDTRKALDEIMRDMIRYNNKITNGHCRVLDAAVHFDESTPHIHIRKVWIYNEDGMNKIGAGKALEHVGYPLPDPAAGDKPTKYNNRKKLYDNMMRERLYNLCRERGIEIDTVPDRSNDIHLSKENYVLGQIQKDFMVHMIKEKRKQTVKVPYRELTKGKNGEDSHTGPITHD